MRVIFFVPVLIFSLLIFTSCKKDEEPKPQLEENSNQIDVSLDQGSLRYQNGLLSFTGKVDAAAGYTITGKGICFGYTALPVFGKDSVRTLEAGSGSFNASIKPASFRTDLFIRAFAISVSSAGKIDTTYGSQLQIKPYHLLKPLKLSTSSTDSVQVTWSGLSICRILGLGDVLAKGICWGLSPNPRPLSGTYISASAGDSLGRDASITGLLAGTRYYFRAFAVSNADTIFGADFITSTGLRDADQNLYSTLIIGNQLWMGSNLRASKFSNGDTLQITSAETSWDSLAPPSCAPSADNAVFGRFYNYYAVVNSKNLCPTGWKVPSKLDWDTLVNFLGGWESAGLAMKARSTAWGSSIAEGQGSSAFNALPAGKKSSAGPITLAGKLGFWWLNEASPQYYRITDLDKGILLSDALHKEGASVRCLKRL